MDIPTLENKKTNDNLSAFSHKDLDILGEVGNINLGASATALSAILQQRVTINAPTVSAITHTDLHDIYRGKAVAVRINYSSGLSGSNILILKDRDVKIITDLMMGGAGVVTEPIVFTDMDMSAISEAMNQMVGATATSLSSMLKTKVDISIPHPFTLDFTRESASSQIGFKPEEVIYMIRFRMEISTLVESEVVQLFNKEDVQELIASINAAMLS